MIYSIFRYIQIYSDGYGDSLINLIMASPRHWNDAIKLPPQMAQLSTSADLTRSEFH